MRIHRSALLVRLAIFVVATLLASPAQAQTVVRCRTSGGSLVDCTTPLLNTYINWGSPSAIGGTAPAAVTGTTITATTQFSGPATGLTGIPGGQITGSLSGVTINCTSNACLNIALTSAVTGVLPIANGGTNSGTALNNNRGIVSSGGALIETASTCPAGTMLGGGSPPDCTQSGVLATQLTTPKVTSTSGLSLNAASGSSVIQTVNNVAVLTTSGTGVTAAQPLAMSNNKITGLATATTTGDALSFPWLTANIATAVATTTTLADTSGTYTDVTGATLSLTAGTHIVATTLRAEIGATTGAGAFITCRLHDGTNPITSTETLITQANQLLVLAQNTTTLIWPVTVGSTTSVKVQCTRVFSGVLFMSDLPSDGNGRVRMFSVQNAPPP